jgi:hypothetical protein
MDEDLDQDVPAQTGPEPEAESEPETDEETDTETAVVPKSLFPGKTCKPGDELTVRVDQVLENEYAVSPVSYKHKGEGQTPKAPATPPAKAATSSANDLMEY